ncbi:MAG TPA: DHH family phosphoesterase [bacterium]|nr:DHH family phosphoesterase [bacterium]HPN44466.1 DHH family phosphoesterase [bacterium]
MKILLTTANTGKVFQELAAQLDGGMSLLILMHDNPDPDALASAFALKQICEGLYHSNVIITYGGLLTRAENRTMVRLLGIPVYKIDTVDMSRYDRIALIDTQPGRGNNSLPTDARCNLVFDHHPVHAASKADVIINNTGVGATATLLTELYIAGGLTLKANLATALAYAIRTETQELNREASDRDIKAYLAVYPRSSLRKLGKISFPKLRRSYFNTLSYALKHARVYRNVIVAHLDFVETPELIAEVADMLLRYERMSWALVTGFYKNSLYLSLRTAQQKIHAHRIILKLVDNKRFAGGHETFAGGRIAVKEGGDNNLHKLVERTWTRFTSALGYTEPEWKNLLDEEIY